MPHEGFASGLWKNVQAVRIVKDGGIEAPVRASRRGIVVGLDAIARSEAAEAAESATASPPRATPRWWKRLLRR